MNALFAPVRRIIAPVAAASRFLALPLACAVTVAALPTAVQAADPATFTVGAFTFKRPATWAWVPVTSTMRKAQLRVANPFDPNGPGAETVFFNFGAGQGGNVDENISRWLGQFTDGNDKTKPVIETADFKGTKVTRVRVATGTFSSGMPGGPTTPQTNYGLYGVIMENATGNVFIKMTGPADLVNAASPNFEAMIQSPFQSGS